MASKLVITLAAEDHAGLIEKLANTLKEHSVNWLDSRFATLSGQCVGVVTVSVQKKNVETLKKSLGMLSDENIFINIHETSSKVSEFVGSYKVKIDVLGQDRPGIIHYISHTLAMLGISIEDIDSRTSNSGWSSESLFQTTAHLRVPMQKNITELRKTLEDLANELMVDIVVQ